MTTRDNYRRRKNKKTANYPDTAAGAIAYLSADSSHEMKNATAVADPAVDGVWKVMLPFDDATEFAIVYLAGYPEPLGRIRESDDFESCDRKHSLSKIRRLADDIYSRLQSMCMDLDGDSDEHWNDADTLADFLGDWLCDASENDAELRAAIAARIEDGAHAALRRAIDEVRE